MFYLEPTDVHYYSLESAYVDSAPSPLPPDPQPPPGITLLISVSLLESIDSLVPPSLHRSMAWSAVRPAALSWLSERLADEQPTARGWR